MAIALNALDPDKYGQVVTNDGIISYQPGTGGLGTIPNPTPAHDTRIGEIASYTSEGQQAQAAHAVTKNNSKKEGQQLFNMSAAAAIPAGGNGTNQALANRDASALGQKVAETAPYAPAVRPVPQPTTDTDISALTDKLLAQQEAERAKFERRRMADRISRMGFALGNLVGAGGGKTDASAITLDDGTKQVGEYRKDMDEINKENQAAYQRALEQIYRKEDQDYKNSEALFKREQADIDNKREDRVADAQIAAYNASAAQRNAAADANTMKAEAYVEKLASDLEKNKKYGDAAIARAAATALRAGAYAEYTRLMGQLKSNGVIKTEEVTDEYGKTKTKKVTTTPVTSGNTGSTAGGGKKTAYGNGGKKKSY